MWAKKETHKAVSKDRNINLTTETQATILYRWQIFIQLFSAKIRKGCQVFSSLNVWDSMSSLHTETNFDSKWQWVVCSCTHFLELGIVRCCTVIRDTFESEVCKNDVCYIVSCADILPGSNILSKPWNYCTSLCIEFSVNSTPLHMGSFHLVFT